MSVRPPTLRQPWHKPRQQAERERKRSVDRRRQDDPIRLLYKTARWKKLRKAQLAEHPLCQCPACDEGRKRITPATVVDHNRPHKGDEALFFNPANLVSMGKTCHDRKTAQRDGGFGNARKDDAITPGCDTAGHPTDLRHHWNRPRRRRADGSVA